MPGHIKKSTGPDPDPSPWLKVSDEFRDRNKSKPYDPKKSCWVPNVNKVPVSLWEDFFKASIFLRQRADT